MKFVGYGVGPSCADASSRHYKLSLIRVAGNKDGPGKRAIIEIMTHEVIYPLTIPYGPVKEKGKDEQSDPALPKDRRRKNNQNKITNILSIECPIR